jgi:microcystin-dependent protein
MSVLPITLVETPGCQKNWTFVEDQSLLPQFGETKLLSTGSVPPGWMKADGSAISRDTYRELFIAIGTTFGSGDGLTTFNLPDMDGLEPLAQQTYIVRVK